MHPPLAVSCTEGLLRSAVASSKNTERADLVVGSHGHTFASLAAVTVSTAEGKKTAAVVGELFQAVGAFAEGLAVGAVGESAVFVVRSIVSITGVAIASITVAGVIVVPGIVVASIVVVVTVTNVIAVIASVVIVVVPSNSNSLTPLAAITIAASEGE